MYPANTRPARGPAQAPTGRRRHRGILALLLALACLAGLATAGLKTSPSGSATPRPLAASPSGTATPDAGTKKRLAAVSWPADGVSAADISGFGVADDEQTHAG